MSSNFLNNFCFVKYEWCFKRTRNTCKLCCFTINAIRNQLVSIGWNFSPNYVFIDSDYLANRFCESFRVLCRDVIPISPACPVRKDQMTNNSVTNAIICDVMANIVFFSLIKQSEIKNWLTQLLAPILSYIKLQICLLIYFIILSEWNVYYCKGISPYVDRPKRDDFNIKRIAGKTLAWRKSWGVKL